MNSNNPELRALQENLANAAKNNVLSLKPIDFAPEDSARSRAFAGALAQDIGNMMEFTNRVAASSGSPTILEDLASSIVLNVVTSRQTPTKSIVSALQTALLIGFAAGALRGELAAGNGMSN